MYVIDEVQSYDVATAIDMSPNSLLFQEAMLTFVAHVVSEPAFDQLRTKQQLGYIVHTAIKRFGNTAALHIIVQSSHKNPHFLNARIEEFLTEFCTVQLPAFTEVEMKTNIHAVLESLLEKPKNLNEEFNRLFAEIKTATYLFNRKKLLADLVAQITLPAVLEFVNRYLLPNARRRKFSSQLYSAAHAYPAALTNTNNSLIVIQDATVFRRSMPLASVERLDASTLALSSCVDESN